MNEQGEMVRICHCNNDNKNGGGAYMITRRVEAELRKFGYVFDYMTMDEFIATGNSDVDLLPGSIAHSARLRGNRWIGHIKLPFCAYSIFRKNHYPIVHVDVDLAGKALLYAVPAKLTDSKVIVHSHSTGINGDHKKLKSFAHHICRQILPLFTDKYIACSREAGQWMFPKRKQKNMLVLVNGTDFNKFYFDPVLRDQYRQNMGLNGKLVIGNIGNVCQIKNQIFLVQILGELAKRGVESELLIIGTCSNEMESRIRNMASRLGVTENVQLLGSRNDTNGLLNAMDIYICPSFIEGAPLTLYEAQATGLPCIMSDTVSDDAAVSDWIDKASLQDNAGKWAEQVIQMAQKFAQGREQWKLDDHYSIRYMAEMLNECYRKLL